MNIFKNRNLLITGGTGSFGNQLINYLKNKKLKKIIIYSRDEMKQWFLQEKLKDCKNLKFIIGDVRDCERLKYAMTDCDLVVHAAATKIVPTAEYNPEECIKTNIIGAMNVIRSAIETKVKKVIALSTDKASSPINLYGASKLCSDKLFTSQVNNDSIKTKFAVVRYGNVLGSRGSVIPFFLSKKNNNETIPITHKDMTRFFLTLEETVKFVEFAFKKMEGGEIYVKKLNSINIVELAKIISPRSKLKYIGIRAGEKIHEQMIGKDDSEFTLEYKNHYEILPNFHIKNKKIKKGGKKVKQNFYYSSDNTEVISKKFLINEINKINKKQIF
jgi:UDP-N-acetylglucosamine 4,6-dehydratase/5-epimerase